MKLRILPVLAIFGTLGLAACGNDHTPNNDMHTNQSGFNDADVTFAQGMIPGS